MLQKLNFQITDRKDKKHGRGSIENTVRLNKKILSKRYLDSIILEKQRGQYSLFNTLEPRTVIRTR